MYGSCVPPAGGVDAPQLPQGAHVEADRGVLHWRVHHLRVGDFDDVHQRACGTARQHVPAAPREGRVHLYA